MKLYKILIAVLILSFTATSCATLKSISDTVFTKRSYTKRSHVKKRRRVTKRRTKKNHKKKVVIQKKKDIQKINKKVAKKAILKRNKEDIQTENTILGSSKYVARLGSTWNSTAFKYVSINGDRYTIGIINDTLTEKNINDLFYLSGSGALLVRLATDFELEVVFYPPNTAGHEIFNSFEIQILKSGRTVVQSEKISNRLKDYVIFDKNWK